MLQPQSGWRAPAALLAVIGMAQLAPVQAADTYKIVPSQSTFQVLSKTSSPLARLRHTRVQNTSDFSGQIVFSGPNKPSAVNVAVKADSLKCVIKDDLNASTAARVDLVTKRDILEADKYPTITFKSTSVSIKPGAGGAFSGTVKGNLSLHGVTKPVSLPVSGKISGGTVKGSGSLVINQTAYGITLISIMGGMIAAQDPVTLNMDFVAKK